MSIWLGDRVFSAPRETLASTRLRQGNRVISLPRQRFVTRVPQPQRFVTQVSEPERFVTRVPEPQRFVTQVSEPEGFNPYSFQYEVSDDNEQTYHSRQEEGDSSGEVIGTYSYVDPFGSLVNVNYRAGVAGYSETREVTKNYLEVRPTNTRVVTTSRRILDQPFQTFSRSGEPTTFTVTSNIGQQSSRSSRKQFLGEDLQTRSSTSKDLILR